MDAKLCLPVISKNGKPILMGNLCPYELWTTALELPALLNSQENLVYDHSSPPAKIVQFLHASLVSPMTSMLLNVIGKNSHHGPDSPEKPFNNIYQNQLPWQRAISINNAKNTHRTSTHPEDSDFKPAPQKLCTQEYYCATVRTTELNHITYSDFTS